MLEDAIVGTTYYFTIWLYGEVAAQTVVDTHMTEDLPTPSATSTPTPTPTPTGPTPTPTITPTPTPTWPPGIPTPKALPDPMTQPTWTDQGWLRIDGDGPMSGLVLYGLDGLIFLLVADWVGLAFHVLALVFIFNGFMALRKLKATRASGQPPMASGP